MFQWKKKKSEASEKKYKIGVVLSGGGARGFAHLGVLKALEEKGIQPDLISGVSAGALAGVFYAAGYQPEEIHKLLKDNRFGDMAKVIIPRTGLLSLDKVKEIIKKHIKQKDLSELKTPLIVATTDLNKGETRYFDKGDLVQIIQASMSIPVLFSPVEIEGHFYSDGGLLDNLPVECIREQCNKIIAINISPVQETEKTNNLIEIAARTFQLGVNSNTTASKKLCDVLIEPERLSEFEILDAGKADELFDVGYQYTKKADIKSS